MEGPAPGTLHQEQLERRRQKEKKGSLLWQQKQDRLPCSVSPAPLPPLPVNLRDHGDLSAGHQAAPLSAHILPLVLAFFSPLFSPHAFLFHILFHLRQYHHLFLPISPPTMPLMHSGLCSYTSVPFHCLAICLQSHQPETGPGGHTALFHSPTPQ